MLLFFLLELKLLNLSLLLGFMSLNDFLVQLLQGGVVVSELCDFGEVVSVL